MRRCPLLIVLVPVLLNAGCGSAPETATVPVEDRSIRADEYGRPIPPEAAESESGAQDTSPPERRAEDQSPAVTVLLSNADTEDAAGRYDEAALALERALRVEPKNAYLWYRLATVRLQQGNWQQAYVMANKSNSLVSNSPELQILNWEVIARAMQELGDEELARQAEQEILRLQQVE